MAAAPYDKSDYSPFNSFAFEQITVAGTAVGFTAATFNPGGGAGPAKQALIECETAQLRYTTDGTTPTATVGHLLNIGDRFVIYGNDDVTAFRAIRVGASGQLNVTYMR